MAKTFFYFDNEYTLTLDIHEEYEAEANFFASGALFQLERFDEEMKSLPFEIGSPLALAKKFGGSNHAAIRGYAERNFKRCALLVSKKIPGSPHFLSVRNLFHSGLFTKNFGMLDFSDVLGRDLPFVGDYSRGRKVHKDGLLSVEIADEEYEFAYHYFYNQHNVFVLFMPVGETNKSKTVIHVMSKRF